MDYESRDVKRGRRLLQTIAAESEAAVDELELLRQSLDGRLAVALRLLADASAEYVRAVNTLQRVSRAHNISEARKAAQAYLVEIGRRPESALD